ncbi:patellin-4 [Phtheirospermum japonicum]|uniref:Patellin-4 n=1 Tax=Phtheirospermum japonicum TaxID=374723 RepID=A0A830C563_9LAMI|nr:patellin-4 [Phtheirospermum japonicum]
MAGDGKEDDAEKPQSEASPGEKTYKEAVALNGDAKLVGEGNGETEKTEHISDKNEKNKEIENADGDEKAKKSNESEKGDKNDISQEIEKDVRSFPPLSVNETKSGNECEKDEITCPVVSNEKEKGKAKEICENGEPSEQNVSIPNLTGFEKKALLDLRSKLENAISSNTLFAKKQASPVEKDEKTEKNDEKPEANAEETDKDVFLWGVPLLPSKGDNRTDTLLFKFLKARDLKPNDALEMLKNTLEWRRENKINSIIDEEDLGAHDYDSVAFMKGTDREGHPICYNVYGVFANEEMYNKTFGNEEGRERFLRWRMQLLEKQIMKLDFRPGKISTLLQVNDLKNAPGPSRRDLRLATKRAVGIFQDNYPEFVARNIFINVPFWYYAFNALLSPFLMQRTKSKFVFSRPSRVTETLLKYITAAEIPVVYGGLRREDDPDFSIEDAASEVIVRAGATGTIEIPAPEVGNTLMWDLTIVGWDVNYKEEFVPTDEASYTVIVKKGREISWQQEPIRNTFKNKEPGKVVITVENGIFKKKRVLYRYKTLNHSTASSST